MIKVSIPQKQCNVGLDRFLTADTMTIEHINYNEDAKTLDVQVILTNYSNVNMYETRYMLSNVSPKDFAFTTVKSFIILNSLNDKHVEEITNALGLNSTTTKPTKKTATKKATAKPTKKAATKKATAKKSKK